jgi:hypothetical protein
MKKMSLFKALSVFAFTMVSVTSHANVARTLADQRMFYLEEVQCNMNFWATRINILDSRKQNLAYFQTKFLSWNRDLVLYDAQDRDWLETDIRTFLKLRSAQHIVDKEQGLIAVVEEELLNSIVNKVGTAILDAAIGQTTGIQTKTASPYRRYSIYNAQRQLVGVSRKVEGMDTVVEFVTADEKTILARATKNAGAKLGSALCMNAMWTVEVFGTPERNPASDPRVIATVVAIKAKIDAEAAASVKWEFLDGLLSAFNGDKEKKSKDEI